MLPSARSTTLQPITTAATQSRLRVGHYVFGGPNIDVLVNGEVAVISDRPWANIPHGRLTGYLYLPPGTYSVAVVPTGEDIEAAIIGPLDVELAAGHRYAVAMMGQTTDEQLKPLVIDETAEVQKVRTSPSQSTSIWFHNVAGVETINYAEEMGFVGDVNYGEFGVNSVTPGDERLCNDWIDSFDGETIFTMPLPDPDTGLCFRWEPAMDMLEGYYGRYPGEEGETWAWAGSSFSSELNVLEMLQEFNKTNYLHESMVYKFNTFLDAVEKAGLTNLLTTEGPYRIYAPTDEAFSKLPEGELDALMADPEALENLLRAHIIEGYYPYGTFGLGDDYAGLGRTFKNLLGQDIRVTFEEEGGVHINGIPEGTHSSFATVNGSTARVLPAVLMPPNQ